MATQAISDRWSELQAKGIDLGPAQGEEQDAGYGGRYQDYEKGRIYWHPSTGARALQGRLLQRYVQAGGHDVNPATGLRELGFPKTGHVRTEDGRYDSVLCEWGIIDDVDGTASVRLFGKLYEAWRAEGGELGRLGHPIDDVKPVAGGQAAWFERGVLWQPDGGGEVLLGELLAPTLGQPAFVDPENPGSHDWMRFSGNVAALDANSALAGALMQNRLHLHAVGDPPATFPVPPGKLNRYGEERWLSFVLPGTRSDDPRRNIIDDTRAPINEEVSDGAVSGSGGAATPSPTKLERRRLYSLAFRTPGLPDLTISHHCVYARSDWETFGMAHITDIHVSGRLESFRGRMRARGVAEEDVALFNNPNDRYRDFISYANHLHAAGLLDVVIATGDLVDYLWEDEHHPNGGGNFALFEAITLGKFPINDPLGSPSEELRVPIFTSLGNHDYRAHPFPLCWNLDNYPDDTHWHHAGFNLLKSETLHIMGVSESPDLSSDEATRAVKVSKEMVRREAFYFRHINRARSYLVPLGKHRVVMVDTKWDAGIVDSLGEALAEHFGLGSESMSNFVGGSPDSVGFNDAEMALVRTAVEEAGEDGMVVVGMHAPPINPRKTDLPNCLRETARQVPDEKQVLAFLARVSPLLGPAVTLGNLGIDVAEQSHPSWPRSGTPYMHLGPVDDLLDWGIAVGNKQEVVELFAGKGLPRPVNLVCSGHGHNRIEYRLRWNPGAGKLETYMDHYLDNPAAYYPLKYAEGEWWELGKHRRYLVHVKPGAPPNGFINQAADTSGNIWHDRSYIEVPPYPAPLASAENPKDWWSAHSPVIVQTASLGQADNTRVSVTQNEHFPGPNHQGFRMIQFVDNVIAKVHYVHAADLRGAYPLAWEPPRPTPPDRPLPGDRLREVLAGSGLLNDLLRKPAESTGRPGGPPGRGPLRGDS